MKIEDIDIEELRKDLIDYYQGIMFNISPAALVEMTEVEYASPEKLIEIALRNNFNLDNYRNKNKYY